MLLEIILLAVEIGLIVYYYIAIDKLKRQIKEIYEAIGRCNGKINMIKKEIEKK